MIPVFDIGNVLIRWDPRHLYRTLFADEAAMERFLAEICTPAWNLEFDRGANVADGVAALAARHPEHAEAIRAFDTRWPEMVPGPIAANVAVLERLRAAGVPTYAITNFSSEKFALAQERFPVLKGFAGIVVSAHERLVKPDPAIYRLFLDRYGLQAGECLFIDDSQANVAGAEAVGMRAIHYAEPMDLAAALRAHGLPA